MESSNFLNIKFENHKIPEFKEVRNKDWIFYGEDNIYPEYLIQLALRSAKHNAILNAKVNYIYGGGLVATTKGASLTQQAKANNFIKMMNEAGFLRRTIQDFEWFNGFYIEPIYNKGMTKLVSINYIPFSKIRANEDESEFYYSEDWKERNQSEEKTGLKAYKPFDPENPQKDQLFYFKLISPKNGKDRNVYPVPEYIGANASIETDIEIANFHLNNIKTGFSAGTIINFNNGIPTDDAKAEIERDIKKKLQGTDRAGSVAITFNRSSDNAPTITSFSPSDLDKQFIEIGKRVEQDIFTGHKITSPMLFGVKTEGQLGGRTEMIDSFELFQNTYIEPRQQILESVINEFAALFGVTSNIEFKRVQAVQTNLPDAVIQKVYDAYPVDQLAEMMGLPKVKRTTKFESHSDCCEEDEIYEVLFEREYTGQTDESCLEEFNVQRFANELTSNQRAIVDLLTKDPKMSPMGIARAINSTEEKVKREITYLKENGYLSKSSNKPTEKGEEVVEEEGAKTDLFEVRYKYAWRPGITPDTRTRDKCELWLSTYGTNNSSIDRAEIDRLDNGQGLGVWDSRGGWWNKNGTNVPFCRHVWKQMIVRKK